MTSETELAWCAGFFDGEGCTYVNRPLHKGGTTGKWYRITSPGLAIAQVRREPLDRFAKVMRENTNVDRSVYGPTKPRTPNSSPYYQFHAYGRQSICQILTLLWPYMSEPKKQQARRVWQELLEAKGPKSPALPELPSE